MVDVGQQSPSATSPGARGEAGERVCDAPNAARSLDLSWAEFCASYKPGPYARDLNLHGLNRDANLLEHILANAFWRMAHTASLRPVGELATAGSCYGNAA